MFLIMEAILHTFMDSCDKDKDKDKDKHVHTFIDNCDKDIDQHVLDLQGDPAHVHRQPEGGGG